MRTRWALQRTFFWLALAGLYFVYFGVGGLAGGATPWLFWTGGLVAVVFGTAFVLVFEFNLRRSVSQADADDDAVQSAEAGLGDLLEPNDRDFW